ncbi:MAG: type II toxin-antitoxin system ParD family antitoxin [Acidobacteria bacterium]|nr:type II toxin-antitoxin system ParD family antitoxin [Acidobacteriota bacterium]MDA1237171.1 type II toxin-antitoxin system ParD family antitoxin [Acidobacteriota bacterium]
MPTRNVNLTDHFDKFIAKRVKSGRFSNASEVVREGLRLLEQREAEDKAKLKWLQEAIQEGIDDMDAGRYTTLNSESELKDFVHKIFEEASREVAAKKGSD